MFIERLAALIKGQVLEQIRLASPFLLRSYDPPIEHLKNKTISGFDRIGKRIVFAFEDDLFLVLHLMIAGRLHWRKKGMINRLRDCFKP